MQQFPILRNIKLHDNSIERCDTQNMMIDAIGKKLQNRLYNWLMRKTANSALRRTGELPLAIGSDIGLVRTENQDRVAVLRMELEQGHSFTVAALSDGMGGMAEGSACASLSIASFFAACIQNKIFPIEERLIFAAQAANRAVHAIHHGRGGATLSAVLYDSNSGMVGVNVGDSRIYAYQDNKLEQVTVDDTMSGLLFKVKDGTQHGNELLQYIGMGDGLEPHVVFPSPDNAIFLTSDGLHFIEKQVMQMVMQTAKDSAIVVRRLLDIAKWCGGHDNASVIGIKPFPSQLQLLKDPEIVQVWDPFGDLQIIFSETVDNRQLKQYQPQEKKPIHKINEGILQPTKPLKKSKPTRKRCTDKAVPKVEPLEPNPERPLLNIYFNGDAGKDDDHD